MQACVTWQKIKKHFLFSLKSIKNGLYFWFLQCEDEDSLTMAMVELLELNKTIGILEAWKNWNFFVDPNKTLKRNIMNIKDLERLKELEKKRTHIISLSYEDISDLSSECAKRRGEYMESTEREIELRYRPSNFFFNKDALIILTETEIPIDIQMGLSLGNKFQFPYKCYKDNLHEIMAQLEHCIDSTITELVQYEAIFELNKILSTRGMIERDDNKNWLGFLNYRIKNFFDNNTHIFATRSDKGGHTVVMEVSAYEEKLSEHLGNSCYVELESDPLISLIHEEEALVYHLKNIKQCKIVFDKMKCVFEPNTLNLPKFYGLPKIHKQNSPIRPITSTTGAVGYYLAKFFDLLLKEIFPRSEYHIRDTYEFAKNIDERPLKTNEVIASFDVVGMFTNIPIDMAKRMIMKENKNFLEEFGIGCRTLAKLISFLLCKCTVFTALDKIYKQTNGIPMGSCISPTVARVFMDRVVEHLLNKIPEISFIRVFVDDTIVIIERNLIDNALGILNSFNKNVKFTVENEDKNSSINFLNMTLIRTNNTIIIKWYKKKFASGRLLNYFSSHKRTTVLNTAVHFIKTVLALSNPAFFTENRFIISTTLRENSFPETLIETFLNESYTYMKPLFNTKQNKEEETYAIFPHAICEGRGIKREINKYKKPKITLADSVKNTKTNLIKAKKTMTPILKRRNIIPSSKCKCGKKYKIIKTRQNETGFEVMNRILSTNKLKCDQYGHKYEKIKIRKGLFYPSQTRYLLKYIQWMYRHKLDTNCSIEYPTTKLKSFISCKCCNH